MRTILTTLYIVCVFGAGANLLAGCGDNPLGASTRMRMLTDAQVEVARAEADAKIAVAEAESRAIVAKHSLWASTLPVALVIIGLFAIGALWLNWRGRYALAALERTSPPAQVAQTALPTIGELRRLARAQGYTLQIEGNYAYLMDGQEVKGRRLLTTKDA